MNTTAWKDLNHKVSPERREELKREALEEEKGWRPPLMEGSMDKAKIAEKVTGIIADELQVDETEVTPGSDLREDLGADSLDIVEIIMQMEEEFDLQIPDEDADKIKTVKNVTDYLEKHVR